MKGKYQGLWVILLICGMALVQGCAPQTEPPAEPTSAPEEAAEEPATAPEEESAPAEEEAAEEPADTGGESAAAGAMTFGDIEWTDLYVDRAIWVGSQSEFVTGKDTEVKTEGEHSLKANTKYDDERVRDLYLAKHVEGLESGQTYTVSVDVRFDGEFADPVDSPYINYIQYRVIGGDGTNMRDFRDIEHYGGHERPETKFMDQSLINNGEFNTLSYEYTLGEDESSLTFMMIVRFRATDRSQNWFYMDNLRVEPAS